MCVGIRVYGYSLVLPFEGAWEQDPAIATSILSSRILASNGLREVKEERTSWEKRLISELG